MNLVDDLRKLMEFKASLSEDLDEIGGNEVRSAAHAVLGTTIGSKVMASKVAEQLAEIVEALAKRHDKTPAEVAAVLMQTVASWRYVSRAVLSDGTPLVLTVRIDTT